MQNALGIELCSESNSEDSQQLVGPAIEEEALQSALHNTIKAESNQRTPGSSQTTETIPNTRYRKTVKDPDFLDLIRTAENSELGNSTNTTSESHNVEDIQRTLADTLALEIASPAKRLPQFEIVFASDNILRRPEVWDQEAFRARKQLVHRVRFLRSIEFDRDVHGSPPETTNLKSLFYPNYSPKELGNSQNPADFKDWELGFHVGLLTLSLREPLRFRQTPVVLRYTAIGHEQSFQAFRIDKERREVISFVRISELINPDLRLGNEMTSEFEKVAADFFGGKEVLTDAEYELKPPPSGTRTKTYTITNHGSRERDEIFEACKQDPKLFQLLHDCLWGNDLESLRVTDREADWLSGASITLYTIGPHSRNVESDDDVERVDLQEVLMSCYKPRDVNEPRQGQASKDEGVLDDSDTESITTMRKVPASNPKGVNKVANPSTSDSLAAKQNSDDTEWMKASEDQETEKTAGSNSKKKRRHTKKNKVNKPKTSQVTTSSESDSQNGDLVTSKPEILANDIASEHLNSFDDRSHGNSREWDVVKNKALPKQGRSLNGAAGQSPMRDSIPVQPRSSPHQKHQVPLSTSSRVQFHKHIATNAIPRATDAIRQPPIETKDGQVQSRALVANGPAKPTLKQSKAPEKPQSSRVFDSEEFPALQNPVSAPSSASKAPLSAISSTKSIKQASSAAAQDKSLHRKPSSGSGTLSSNTSTSNVEDPRVSNAEFRDDVTGNSAFEVSSPNRPDPSHFEMSIDEDDFVESVEQSTAVQEDVAQASDLESNTAKTINNMDEAGYSLVPNCAFEILEPASAENEVDDLNEDLDSDSDVEIITSPRQLHRRAMSPANTISMSNSFGQESTNGLLNNVESLSANDSTAKSEHGDADVVEDAPSKVQNDTSIQFCLHTLPQSAPHTVTLMQGNSAFNWELSIRTTNTMVNRPPYLLFTESEASRVVSTHQIFLRSARYLSNGVALPNYYAELEDEEPDEEKTLLKEAPKQMSSLGVPSVRSATHSEKTGVAVPNFLYVPEHDQDDDTTSSSQSADDQNDEGQASHDHEFNGAGELDVNASDPSYLASHQPINDKMSDGRTSCPASELNIEVATLDDENLSDLAGDMQANSTTSKIAHQESVTNLRSSRLDASDQALGDTEKQENPSPGSTNFASNSTLSTGQILDHSNQSLEAAQSPSAFDPVHDLVGSFDQLQPMFDQSYSNPTFNFSENLSLSAESSQISSQGYAHENRQGLYIANNSNVGNHTSGHSRGPNEAVDGGVMYRPLTQFTALCTHCGERSTPSIVARQVICAGCGPAIGVRYCSVACLLVDSINHSRHCVKYAAMDRAAYHDLPKQYFLYVMSPIAPVLNYPETPERYRQRNFSMYCNSGAFPPLLRAWMKKATHIYPMDQSLDMNESGKKTGEYSVFRSSARGAGPRNNPDCEVILTIKLHPQDPQKQMLTRVLNACYLTWDARLVEFLYRFLKSMILDEESFAIFKYNDPVEIVWLEFTHQFRQEFAFHGSMGTIMASFDAQQEWIYISPIITDLEIQYPNLFYWSK